jgi:uncharacterized protein
VRYVISLGALLCASLFFLPLSAISIPDAKGYVNDYAEMISPDTQSKIEAVLKSFEQNDSTQIVIVTVKSLEGEPIEDFAIRLADKWKVGQTKKDNGAVLIVSKDDRRIRIEVGRGLEGSLTDLRAGRIIDNIIRPSFKSGNYDKGFADGANAIIASCRGEFKNDKIAKSGKSSNIGGWILFLFVGLYVLTIIISNFSKVAAGILGAAGLPAIIHFMISPVGMGGLIIAAIAGFLFGIILPLIPLSGHSRSGGGFWSGGSSGGSGGFSGGGGSFGGGGSSGGW